MPESLQLFTSRLLHGMHQCHLLPGRTYGPINPRLIVSIVPDVYVYIGSPEIGFLVNFQGRLGRSPTPSLATSLHICQVMLQE